MLWQWFSCGSGGVTADNLPIPRMTAGTESWSTVVIAKEGSRKAQLLTRLG